jgi:hypothetical protein
MAIVWSQNLKKSNFIRMPMVIIPLMIGLIACASGQQELKFKQGWQGYHYEILVIPSLLVMGSMN